MVRNQKFKDNNRIDTRLNGHPMLVLNNVYNIGDTIYCLHITSNFRTSLSHYYEIMLNKRCYIDLKFIYKIECKSQMNVKNTISEKKFNEILDKMTTLHESGTIKSKKEYFEFYDKYISKEKKIYNIARLARRIRQRCDKARAYYKVYLSGTDDKVVTDLCNEIFGICNDAVDISKLVLENDELTREEAFDELREKGYITKNTCKTIKKITNLEEDFVIKEDYQYIPNELSKKNLKDYVENKINVIWQFVLSIKDLSL